MLGALYANLEAIMERIWKLIINFYQNNRDLSHILIGALSATVFMLLVKFLGRILDSIKSIAIYIGKKIGGRFAYKNFLDTYLNWLVAEYQDLNLTGIIGSGTKPKLEQVFISLGFTNQSEIQSKPDKPSRINKLLRRFSKQRVEESKKSLKPKESKPESEVLYTKQKLNTVACFIDRNENVLFGFLIFIFLILAIGLFFALPNFLLFNNHSFVPLTAGIAGIILGTAVIFMVWGFFGGIKDEENWLIGLSIFGLVLYTLLGFLAIRAKGLSKDQVIYTLLGAILSISVVAIWRWIESKQQQKNISKNRFAEQTGTILKEFDRIAILGKPGAGKSTYVQFLTLVFAREKAGDRKLRKQNVVREKLGLNKWYFPILIPLQTVARILQDGKDAGNINLLLDAWRNRVLPSDIRASLPEKYLLNLLKKGRCLILLDGLDEVSNDIEFKAVVQEIKGFTSRYRGNKYIITSRFSGWRGGLGSTFQEFHINDLVNEQIVEFVYEWYSAIEENHVFSGLKAESTSERLQRFRKAESKANSLMEAFEYIDGIRSLSQNPLLLSLICFVHYNQALPRERVSLYQECSKLLLMQWDLEKGFAVDDTDLVLRQKEMIMQEIAFSLHSGKIGEGFSRKEATSKEIIPIIEEKLKQFSLPKQNALILFEKLVSRSGVIVCVEKYTDRYSFSHLTFQEFYTAKYIFENNLPILDALIDSAIDQLTGWWKEVALLYVSMIGDSSSFIKKFSKSFIQDVDDIAYKRLQVTAQCLSQAVGMQDPTIEIQILERLFSIRTNKPINSSCLSKPSCIYLKRFASSPTFPNYSIEHSVTNLKESISTIVLLGKLLDLTKSPDSDIALAAINGIIILGKNADLSSSLHIEDIELLLDYPSVQIKAKTLKLLLSQTKLIGKHNICEKVLSYLFTDENIPLEPFFDRYPPHTRMIHYGSVDYIDKQEIIYQSINQFLEIPFEDQADKKRLLKELWYLYNNKKLSYTLRYDSPIRSSIVATIIKMSESDKLPSYIDQLRDMLRFGNRSDQLLSTDVISQLSDDEIQGLSSDLIDALKSPYSKVRQSVMKILSTHEYESDKTKTIQKRLTDGLATPSIWKKYSIRLTEAISGIGCIGSDPSERLSILVALARLGIHNPVEKKRELGYLLNSFKISSKNIQEIINIINLINQEFSETLYPEIESRLFEIFDSLVKPDLFREYGNHDQRELVDSFLRISNRFGADGKKTLEQWLLSQLKLDLDDPLLSSLLKLISDLEAKTTIPNNLREILLDLLGHRTWYIADKAFDIASQYKVL